MSAGTIIGEVYENELMTKHHIMIPPGKFGKIVELYGDGSDGKEDVTLEDTVKAGAGAGAGVAVGEGQW